MKDFETRTVQTFSVGDLLDKLLLEQAGSEVAGTSKRLRPFIDLSSNGISCDGRLIRLAFTVEKPSIVLMNDVLTHEECDALVAGYQEKLKRASVVSHEDGSSVISSARTSHNTYIKRGETPLIACIERRLAALVNWPENCGEGIQLLQYMPGQEYTPHFDWFHTTTKAASHLARGGQRVATMLVYLSDVEAGGSTSFPKLGLEVYPQKGSVLFFANIDDTGAVDELTLHAGRPVVRGTKFVATKWLRETEFV